MFEHLKKNLLLFHAYHYLGITPQFIYELVGKDAISVRSLYVANHKNILVDIKSVEETSDIVDRLLHSSGCNVFEGEYFDLGVYYAINRTSDEILLDYAFLLVEGIVPMGTLDSTKLLHNLEFNGRIGSLYYSPLQFDKYGIL